MSSQPFGATPPPAQGPGGPAQDPTAGASAAAAKRSPLIRFGVPVAAGLLLAGGLAAVLTGGPAADDTAPEAVSPPPATATPEPEPSLEAPETLPVSAERNPFDPLVRAASVGTGPDTGSDAGSGAGGIGTTPGLGSPSGSSGSTGGSTGSIGGSSGAGSSSTGSSNGSGGTSSGSGNGGSVSGDKGSGNGGSSDKGSGNQGSGTKPPPPPGPAALAEPDAVATCKAGDDLWKTYREAMKDASTTHTMAGHRLGPVTTGVGDLARTTSAAELRQPLQAWERATASVRTQLVNGRSVRDVAIADPLENSTGGAPFVGTRPIVDESSILLARTSVRERCYQLTDPLVNQGDL